MYKNRTGIVFGVKDVWNLDTTLSPIILSALLKFKECSAGHKGIPGNLLFEMFPDNPGYSYTDEQSEQASQRWDEIIDTMIYAFNLKNEPKIRDYGKFFSDNLFTTDENGNKKLDLTITNKGEHSRYNEDLEKHQAKVKEGHLLFGKYFQNLWY